MNLFWLPSRAWCIARSIFALRLLTFAMRIKGDERALKDRAVLLDFLRGTRVRDVLWHHERFAVWAKKGHAIMAALELGE